MKIHSYNSFKTITFFLLIVVGTTSSHNNAKCPFRSYYQFGDGITDTGNSVRVPPFGHFLPPTRYPYGKTYPGRPSGRWSDGLVETDYAAQGAGLPNMKPYLSLDISRTSRSYDGVVFSVARSTVLDTSFHVPPYNMPLSTQISWFRKYLNPILCKNKKDCSKRQPPNSSIVLQHCEANDIGYALEQGKSIQEELIKLGAKRISYSTFTPLGCYPYILTALFTNDPTAYDRLGCLKVVNNLIVSMNTALTTAMNGLQAENPTVTILGADFYTVARTIINQTSVLGSNGNRALKSCCGIGGRYNYDKNRFCGSLNVPVCPNPNKYVFWDGLHFTQEAIRRIINPILKVALPALNCTST